MVNSIHIGNSPAESLYWESMFPNIDIAPSQVTSPSKEELDILYQLGLINRQLDEIDEKLASAKNKLKAIKWTPDLDQQLLHIRKIWKCSWNKTVQKIFGNISANLIANCKNRYNFLISQSQHREHFLGTANSSNEWSTDLDQRLLHVKRVCKYSWDKTVKTIFGCVSENLIANCKKRYEFLTNHSCHIEHHFWTPQEDAVIIKYANSSNRFKWRDAAKEILGENEYSERVCRIAANCKLRYKYITGGN